MRSFVVLVILLLSIIPPLAAGELPTRHLTGNPQVDFFGKNDFSHWAQLNDARHSLQQMEDDAPSADGEKSPWLAAGMSLLVPGAGEVYTKNYLKGALFFAAEAAFWFTAYTYDKKGNDQTKLFEAFANEHWSATRYTEWLLNHIPDLNSNISTSRDEWSSNIYGDNDPEEGCNPPFSCIDWQELNRLEREVAAAPAPNGFTHVLPYYAEQQYYELIGKYPQFSRGWDDASLEPPGTSVDLPIRSNSSRYFEYAQMRADANGYYDVASTFVSVVVINHIVSALDAYWSATRFNKNLHASLQMKAVPTQSGMSRMAVAKLRYDF